MRTLLTEASSTASLPPSLAADPPELVEGPKAPARCFRFLHHLSKVPRFDMAVMCLPSRDKAALRDLWDRAVQSLKVVAQGEHDVTGGSGLDIEALKAAYKL